MVERTLALAVSPGEVWAAAEEAGELVALEFAREEMRDTIGAVYLGRIVALRPELRAALVDIGLERPGFLDAHDADRKKGIAGLAEGAAIIVEVIKSARADKAAGLRIVTPDDARIAALGPQARRAAPPARLDTPEPAIIAAAKPLLDPPPDRILVDDRGAVATLRNYLRRERPAIDPNRAVYGAPPLFEQLGIADAVDAVLQPSVALPGGGAIHIEPTHAATLVDVDGGARNALTANLAAAPAIARQIRLRHLAGPIVIDFVGMKQRAERDKVEVALTAALAADEAKPDVLGWTRLGHLELVRRRRAPPLAERLFEPAPDGSWRKTALTLALEALRRAAREAEARPGKSLTLAVHPDLAAALGEGAGAAAVRALEARLGERLGIEAEPRRAREAIDIRPR